MTDFDPDATDAPPAADQTGLEMLRSLVAGGGLTNIAEPDDDDPAGDTIEWVRTGVVRVWLGEDRYRLRRPLFGELRKLDQAWENALEEIKDKSADAETIADRLKADAQKLDENTRMTDERKRVKVRELQREDTRVAREMNEHREDTTAEWWRQVFEMLSVDGVPDGVAGWMTSVTLPHRALQHWRSVPLGRGGQQTGTTQPRS